ncbi:MAG: flagellar biosynthesis protein FlhA [Leptospiraceae bacterium]|nr:flagellar biosynthesis protein FlhA [Leptospiraceae bacterium]MDW8306641.1 flagellar biosynthesis protein FlhA [Leptospiraceae bacterium]
MKWYENPEVALGVAIIAVLAMLVIPIPTFLLDTLLAVSIMIGLITLLTAMNNREVLDFSVFPSLLLVSTVFRLALNVSSTRLILLEGPAFDGAIIKAFGQFVVGGNYVVGFIIFIVLVLVQMMVISKGATRISEVAARFQLDGLPGKQMSIDNDLSAGLITEEEARRRRELLRREVDFYGQMDGASKFVQGDVRVGLVITVINIVGGLIVGTTLRGESLEEALKTYTLLTIGDGLVAQIPSLLITTATGMVVTRSGARENLSHELRMQLFQNARLLFLTGGALFLASFLPGFPMLTLWIIGGALAFLGYTIASKEEKEKETAQKKQAEEKIQASGTERFLDDINLDPVKLELGFGLIPLLEKTLGGGLKERITGLRQKLARDMGMVVPPIRISDNMDLKPNEYAILIGGTEVDRAEVYPDKLVAMDVQRRGEKIEGDPYREPAYNTMAVLIAPEKKTEAEQKGFVVVDASTIIITHLSKMLTTYATQVMGREEVKALLDKVKQRYPTAVDEITKQLSLSTIMSVFHNLLKENVSIRNMGSIVETLANHAERVKDPVTLTELVRQRLGRQIANQYVDKNGVLQAIQVDPAIENELAMSLTYDEREGRIFHMDPHLQIRLRDAFVEAMKKADQGGYFPVFLTSAQVRTAVVMLLERDSRAYHYAVLAYEEIPPEIKVQFRQQVMMPQEALS